jgi:hypothetical protein
VAALPATAGMVRHAQDKQLRLARQATSTIMSSINVKSIAPNLQMHYLQTELLLVYAFQAIVGRRMDALRLLFLTVQPLTTRMALSTIARVVVFKAITGIAQPLAAGSIAHCYRTLSQSAPV